MEDLLSTREVGWILDRSAGSIREGIRDGAIESVRLPAGFRIPKAEALRLARERIEQEGGQPPGDRRLEALIDQVIERNTSVVEAAPNG